MQQLSLAYKSSRINYYVFGKGNKILFCLHGYGEGGTSFAFLEKYIGSEYSIYALDFPFHGATEWNEHEPFTTEDLMTIIQLIEPVKNKISLLAYSMGGRATMHLLQLIPEKIEHVVLVAPDGLHANIWYWMATQTTTGNKLFSYTMNNPRWFFTILDTGGRLQVFNKSILKFVHYYLDEKEQRLLLYRRWTYMRKMKPDLHAIKNLCVEKNIKLNFLFGEYDRIILSKRADVFKGAKNISIKIINAGHQLLKEKYAEEIIKLLND